MSDHEKQAHDFVEHCRDRTYCDWFDSLNAKYDLTAEFERIARDARAEERENCAVIAENSGMASGEEIAKRIRAGEAEKGAAFMPNPSPSPATESEAT